MSESEKSNIQKDESPTVVESFNSATEHYHKIMGMPKQRVNLNSMPKWLRLFYYFIICVIAVGLLFVLYTTIFK